MTWFRCIALLASAEICLAQYDEYVDSLIDQVDVNRDDISVDLLQARSFEVNNVFDADTCDAFDAANPTLVKVDFTLADNTVSNLGGLGPQTEVAEQLYYKNAAANAAGDAYDLKVTVHGNGKGYQSKKPKRNGISGHYGIINVDCGTSVDVDFQFIDGKTGQPATLESLIFSWFDLDKGRLGGGDEEITLWPGHGNVEVSSFSEVKQKSVPCPSGAGAGTCKTFQSSTWGVGGDNPDNPMTLTKQQAARTFSATYKDVSSFSVTLTAHDGFGNRNFLFTGMSEIAYSSVEECCPVHICGCQSFCADKTREEKCSLAKCAACDECAATTTTTTPVPATKEEACQDGLTFELTNLAENTLGSEGGRMLFNNVLTYQGRSLDLSVTDVAAEPAYANQGRTAFSRDNRDYTGLYKDAGRIAVDKPGLYMFRFTFLDSELGEQVQLPLFPFSIYDIDGQKESVGGCNLAGVITAEGSKLTEYFLDNCYSHISLSHESNIPQDFESLTPRQKKKSVTYVYRNTAVWDVAVTLLRREKQRYILFKSSKVLACGYADKTRDRPWKNNNERKADA